MQAVSARLLIAPSTTTIVNYVLLRFRTYAGLIAVRHPMTHPRFKATLSLLWILLTPGVSSALDGQSERGRYLYERSCIACHTTDAAGNWFKAVPALAGQRPEYLRLEIDAFTQGLRKKSSMHWVLRRRPLNHRADRAALIFYLSVLPIRDPVSGAVRGDEKLGQTVYERGCSSCHGADGLGSAPEPIIAHQQDSYLVDRIRDIRQGSLTPMTPGMNAAVLPLTDPEIAAVANFLSRMPAVPPR